MKLDILQQIKYHAIHHPKKIAYHSMLGSITYEELDQYSDNFAIYLNEKLPNDDKKPILVYGHKSPYMLICFLACVKSGRAYCPIDISVPLERIKIIVQEIDSSCILTTEKLELIPPKNCLLLNLEQIKVFAKKEHKKIALDQRVKEGDVFYIIFTSGSTGAPKGVQITTSCLNHFLDWSSQLGNLKNQKEETIFLNQAPFSFDLSVMDLYTSLYLGGTLWALEKQVQENMKLFLESLKCSKVTVWVSTPSFVELCLSDQTFNHQLLPELEVFLFCGETLNNNTYEKLQAEFPKAEIINTYGPTESTVAVTGIHITKDINKKYKPLPIGIPKEGTTVLIMDDKGNIKQNGEKGEIVIIGDTVSVGYYKNKEQTEKKFGFYEIDGLKKRMYHTGDEGYKQNELLFYTGRMDLQIKLHGYRIELGDIEHNIRKLTYIKNAVVIPARKGEQVVSLTAFVIAKMEEEREFEKSQRIRKDLKEHLPLYMIPKKIRFIDSFPMTNNGKIDRKKLGGSL